MRLQKHLPSLIVYVFRLLKESIENVVTMQRKREVHTCQKVTLLEYTSPAAMWTHSYGS